MTNALPKLLVYYHSGRQIDGYLTHNQQHFHQESLHLLGIPPQQIVSPVSTETYQADQLLVTNTPTIFGHIPERMSGFLRDLFLPISLPLPTKKLYLKRVTTRKIYNDKGLEAMLKKNGFETVVLDTMSVQEQARLFASATHIIGPHGA